MAVLEKLIPHIIKWEAGVVHQGDSLRSLFERAKKTGLVNDKDDAGGLTQVGVTYRTFTQYCLDKGLEPTPYTLENLQYEDWYDILKTMYWDRWRADNIKNQSVANILVDWVWASGVHGIKRPQRLLGVKDDGIVGKNTLNALNGANQEELFAGIVFDREQFIEEIIERRPKNAKFRNGWLNRIRDFRYEG